MWRQSAEEINHLVREQLWKQETGGVGVGAAVRKVQLGRVENGDRSCDCWELCSQLRGTHPCNRFNSRYLSEIWTCSSVTSGSPVVSVPQLPNPAAFSVMLQPLHSLWPPCSPWLLGSVPSPGLVLTKPPGFQNVGDSTGVLNVVLEQE